MVHGWSDAVVPVQSTIEFARLHRCDQYLLEVDHRLNDALPKIELLFEVFVRQVADTPFFASSFIGHKIHPVAKKLLSCPTCCYGAACTA